MIRKAPETPPCSLISASALDAFHPLVRSDGLVNRSSRFHKPGLQSCFRPDMRGVAPNSFGLSIDRNFHPNSGSVETPRKGPIFEVEEICLVKIHEQSMNFVFANDDLFGASVSNKMLCSKDAR
jgi:hypothetical protein